MPNILMPRRVATPFGLEKPVQSTPPRLIIVGGGIGGVTLARQLAKTLRRAPNLMEVILFDAKDLYVFKPRLYEWLNGEDATVPMHWLFPLGGPIRFIQGQVERISLPPAEKFVQTAEDLYEYDYLVIATGAKTSYYNVVGAKTETLPLDNLEDIRNIKQRVMKKLQHAAASPPGSEERLENLSFEIIGGGATGIELAFELKYLIEEAISECYPQLNEESPLVQVLEGTSSILPGFSQIERERVMERMQAENIGLLLNHRVRRVEPGRLIVDKQDMMSRDFTEIAFPCIDPIWVTGVRANVPDNILPEVERYPGNGRIRVNQYMEMVDHPNIYVIGDVAGLVDLQTGNLLPPVGQVVEQQAAYVAGDLIRRVRAEKNSNGKSDHQDRKPFIYHSRGRMLAMGPGQGLMCMDFLPGPLKNLCLGGRLASRIRDWYYDRKLKPF